MTKIRFWTNTTEGRGTLYDDYQDRYRARKDVAALAREFVAPGETESLTLEPFDDGFTVRWKDGTTQRFAVID